MVQDITAGFPEVWSSRLQVPLHKTLVALKVASVDLQKELKVGEVIHKGYISDMTAVDYQPNVAITAQACDETDDSVTATTKKVVPFYVDDVDLLQSKADVAGAIMDDAAYRLRDAIDSAVLGAVTDGTDFGTGASGFATGIATAITVGTANVIEVFSKARQGLRELNVEEAGDWIAVIRPDIAEVIEETATGKGMNVADATLRNGYAGSFLGFKIYVSNNMTSAHAYVGKKGAIDLIMLQAPKMVIKDVDNQLGKNFLPYTVYGHNTLNKNKSRFLDMNVA